MDREAVVIRINGEDRSFPGKAVAQVRLVPDLSGLEEDSGIQIADIIDDDV